MYLEHFGLNEPPFKITPVTDFFFPGANRAEILDALLYAITESEGIIKVTGEVGSGKTMLCRMLLEKFPAKVEAVYLANPSLSREEMLYAIADGLNLNLEGQRVNVILQTLQNHLESKITEGKRVVILVDEAHAMPLETLEELRLLYNLQVGNHKLMHIVLVGQPELNEKLSQPNMRQLKDRIIHHFSMLPLSQNIIESYLLFRMRTAGYRGPSPFSNAAAALIGKASVGLMRRVNILADKSMLAAFVENTHNIEVRHVQAAIRDSELGSTPNAWWKSKNAIIAGTSILLLVIVIAVTAWILGSMYTRNLAEAEIKPFVPTKPLAVASAVIEAPVLIATTVASEIAPTPPAPQEVVAVAPAPAPAITAPPIKNDTPEEPAILLEQRLAATKTMLSQSPIGSASIQLYYTIEVRPTRIEGFLKRADGLGKLQEIYILPIKINGKQGLRILYGVYPNSKEARAAIQQLPKRYLDAYAPSIFLLEDYPV
jgi:type II secretory pathway predicted ATPase ExeA